MFQRFAHPSDRSRVEVALGAGVEGEVVRPALDYNAQAAALRSPSLFLGAATCCLLVVSALRFLDVVELGGVFAE